MTRAPWSDYYHPSRVASTRTAARPALSTLTGMQHRTYAVLDREAVKADVRHIEGRAVPYNVWSDVGGYSEAIAPGAFTRSLQTKSDLPLLLFHNARMWPVGVAVDWDERRDGLYGKWRMDVEDPAAAEALRKVEQGVVRGLSIGFIPDENGDRITEDRGVYRVTRTAGRLLEVSLTPTPAYVGAEVTTVRAAR